MHPDPRLLQVATGRTDLIVDIVTSQSSGPWPEVEGSSILEWAAYYGDVSALRTLLNRGEPLSQLGPDLGLNAAAFHGHWQLCEFMIENGANPKYADPATGETPLHSALTNEDRLKYDLVVKVLLRAGADAKAKTVPGAETGSFMRDSRTRGEGPLHRAAAFGTAATVQLLLDAGAVPEQSDFHGDTPLAWASWYQRPVEVLRPLLHGQHRIHPAYRTMRENLLGKPSGESAA
jgi:ankyrin repeat protein